MAATNKLQANVMTTVPWEWSQETRTSAISTSLPIPCGVGSEDMVKRIIFDVTNFVTTMYFQECIIYDSALRNTQGRV